jgi:hypothetical protein
LAVAGVFVGGAATWYLLGVYDGIIKHTPPCAPVRGVTVASVCAMTLLGAALGIAGWRGANGRNVWVLVAVVAILVNVGALSVWGYWLSAETLLPYEKWCAKVGMS